MNRHFADRAALLAVAAMVALALQATLPVPAGADALSLQAVSLSVDAPVQLVGGTATVTASTLSDVGPTPYYVEIFDVTGARVKACGSGMSCAFAVSQPSPAARCYIAYIAAWGTTNPPPSIQDTSGTVCVNWRLSLVLNGTPTDPFAGSPATLTATSATTVSGTPYYIEIFDEAGGLVRRCATGTTCSVAVSNAQSTHTYVAYVALSTVSPNPPPPGVQASSNSVAIAWQRPVA